MVDCQADGATDPHALILLVLHSHRPGGEVGQWGPAPLSPVRWVCRQPTASGPSHGLVNGPTLKHPLVCKKKFT